MAYGTDITETLGSVGGRTAAHGYNSADEVRKQYTGYERDDESGLDFAQARHYNSNHGRFTSVDPLTASANVKDPQTFNRYSYALNSPYKFTDPLGLLAVGAAPNTNRSGYGGGGAFNGAMSAWKGTFARTEGAGPIAQNDGTVEAEDIPVDVATYDQVETTAGETANLDAALSKNATAIAETVAKNKVAYEQNKANWQKETKDFNNAIDNSSSFEIRDYTTDLTSDRPIGTVNDDGTITNVPGEHTPGSLSLNLPVGGSGDSYMTANTLGVASANKANKQVKLLNEMQSPESRQRRTFIKENSNNTITVTRPNSQGGGLRHTTYKLGASNAGIIYDNAVKRGLTAAANYLAK